MKTLFIIAIAIFATFAQAQTQSRCVKNYDGSYTCTTTIIRNGF